MNPNPNEKPKLPPLKGLPADETLKRGLHILMERATEYDKPGGERSAARAAQMWAALTGKEMTESEAWLFLACLKLVRIQTAPGPHHDSGIDAAVYSALAAEAKWRAVPSALGDSRPDGDGGSAGKVPAGGPCSPPPPPPSVSQSLLLDALVKSVKAITPQPRETDFKTGAITAADAMQMREPVQTGGASESKTEAAPPRQKPVFFSLTRGQFEVAVCVSPGCAACSKLRGRFPFAYEAEQTEEPWGYRPNGGLIEAAIGRGGDEAATIAWSHNGKIWLLAPPYRVPVEFVPPQHVPHEKPWGRIPPPDLQEKIFGMARPGEPAAAVWEHNGNWWAMFERNGPVFAVRGPEDAMARAVARMENVKPSVPPPSAN